MDWQDLKGGFSIASVASKHSVDEAMLELCERIRIDVIPKNEKVDWDHLRVELWADSGRIIVFPSSITSSGRIEKAGCQVVFSTLLERYEKLADSDLDDNAFKTALLEEEKSWIERFLVAARKVGLNGERVRFWDSEGEQPIRETMI